LSCEQAAQTLVCLSQRVEWHGYPLFAIMHGKPFLELKSGIPTSFRIYCLTMLISWVSLKERRLSMIRGQQVKKENFFHKLVSGSQSWQNEPSTNHLTGNQVQMVLVMRIFLVAILLIHS
jgi:hypothetical protein